MKRRKPPKPPADRPAPPPETTKRLAPKAVLQLLLERLSAYPSSD